MRVLVVSGGLEPSMELIQEVSQKVDYIIGVDRGCNYLIKNNIIPQYIIGDFDSIDKYNFEDLKGKKATIIQFNKDKDSTDTELAFDYAISHLKAKEIYLLGGTGLRLDHFIGNIGVLKRALDKNVKAYMLDHYNTLYLIKNNEVIEGKKGDYISFQAFSEEVENFTIKNAKYELNDYKLTFGDPLTISNEFLEGPITISFKSGTIIIIKSRD